MKKVGLHEIAEKSGVSHVTVSRILTGKADLHKPETVKRVQAVATRMGYRPNILAKSMQTGRTHTIGVILRPSHGSWYSDIEGGVHEGLIARGYLPITLGMTSGAQRDVEMIQHMLGRRVEGLILWHLSDEVVEESARSGLPIVTIDDPQPAGREFDFVGTNDRMGGRLAARHLLELGHRQLGTIGFKGLATMKDRRSSFAAEIRKTRGADCTHVIAESRDPDAIHSAVNELLSGKTRPTAVFAGSDRLAWEAIHSARDLGLTVPADLSVVGYADLDFASMITPALTTVRQHPMDIGQRASELLVDRIEGREKGEKPRRILLDPDLVIRQSTAPLVFSSGRVPH